MSEAFVAGDTEGLGLMSLLPGMRAEAHVHEHHETALYMMSGEVVGLWTGDELEHCEKVQPGDYIYIPADVLHVAVNRGAALNQVLRGSLVACNGVWVVAVNWNRHSPLEH